MRRSDNGMARAAKLVPAQVVKQDENDVGWRESRWLEGLENGRCQNAEGTSPAEFHPCIVPGSNASIAVLHWLGNRELMNE